jgi:Kef-type K+ transport system membrane component KefB
MVRFIIAIAAIVIMPPLSRRLRLPPVVGLLFAGILLGPHVLDVFGKDRPVADFMSELGKLLLMFFAGLEVNLRLFRQSQRKVTIFGIITTTLPLLLGTAVGLWFGFAAIPSIVIGSLLASHTLLGLPIVTELGANRLEPVTVTSGATVMSDTLSLVVFAVCVSTYQRGFSFSVLAVQLVEIIGFVLFVLFVLSRVARYALHRVEEREDAFFVLLFGLMAVAAALAAVVQLPGIVGAFLAGLAINQAAESRPAKEKLGFFANALFIPMFFMVTGFLIDPAGRRLIDERVLNSVFVLMLSTSILGPVLTQHYTL